MVRLVTWPVSGERAASEWLVKWLVNSWCVVRLVASAFVSEWLAARLVLWLAKWLVNG
jgi:hypothetical protein